MTTVFRMLTSFLWRKVCHTFGRPGEYVWFLAHGAFADTDAAADMVSNGELRPHRLHRVCEMEDALDAIQECDQSGHHVKGAFVLKLP